MQLSQLAQTALANNNSPPAITVNIFFPPEFYITQDFPKVDNCCDRYQPLLASLEITWMHEVPSARTPSLMLHPLRMQKLSVVPHWIQSWNARSAQRSILGLVLAVSVSQWWAAADTAFFSNAAGESAPSSDLESPLCPPGATERSCHSELCGARGNVGTCPIFRHEGRHEPYGAFCGRDFRFHSSRNSSGNSEMTCEEHIAAQKYPREYREGGLGPCGGFTSRTWWKALLSFSVLLLSVQGCRDTKFEEKGWDRSVSKSEQQRHPHKNSVITQENAINPD